ncbi:hypothetical protein QUF81_07120 [Peribacillus simplex]|uniref:hypothetical protein n=1 Tax=Peribacillus simplex TaxID=1478 RepID=UPI0025A24861|nr:hypothetical protein [Peribacillus simplex]MDM5292967.1 hypothetical protein [Peribacillus simplex]
MDLFITMYIIGLFMGLVFDILTYLFSKEMHYRYRALMVFGIGFLVLLGSLTIIGGFEGMPFGVLSGGIITISILMLLAKNPFWRKGIYSAVILFILVYATFTYLNKVDYWIVKKSRYQGFDEVSTYLHKIEKDTTIHGYKTFTLKGEGDVNTGVALSLGGSKAGNSIEVLDVIENGGTTEIKVRTFYNQSTEKNPVIMMVLNRLQSDVVIMDTDGTIYENVSKDD